MNYEAFEDQYAQKQLTRIKTAVANIRQAEILAGRVVPDDQSLVLGDGRRLSMAVMFLDVCSFSSRPLETEAEQHLMTKTLNLLFTEMVRVAEDYGGTVEKNTGDGLMAYFEDGGGTPSATGCIRAVACGLTMLRTRTTFIKPVFDASGIQDMQFRLGIEHGNVTIAKLGAPRRFNSIVAIGTTANIACKMLRFAGPSELVIGENVRKALPLTWHQFAVPIAEPSGWFYRSNGQPYPIYRYTGRWTR